MPFLGSIGVVEVHNFCALFNKSISKTFLENCDYVYVPSVKVSYPKRFRLFLGIPEALNVFGPMAAKSLMC